MELKVIEKTEFPHERMGTIKYVTFSYGKEADEDWESLKILTFDEKIAFERVTNKVTLNQVETHYKSSSLEIEKTPWIVTVVTDDKQRQTFVGVLPKMFFSEYDLEGMV